MVCSVRLLPDCCFANIRPYLTYIRIDMSRTVASIDEEKRVGLFSFRKLIWLGIPHRHAVAAGLTDCVKEVVDAFAVLGIMKVVDLRIA